MSDEKVTHSEGGLLIPKIAYKYIPSKRIYKIILFNLGKFIYDIGYHVMDFSYRIKQAGCDVEEYYPHDALVKMMKEINNGR